MKNVYLIGSLRNPEVQRVAASLREAGYEVFDDWSAAGPEADDWWQKYETAKGNDFLQALKGAAAKNVFAFDKRNLLRADMAVMVGPAGKSAHLELGWMAGRNVHTYIYLPAEPERWDVMYQFCDGVFYGIDELVRAMGGATDGR